MMLASIRAIANITPRRPPGIFADSARDRAGVGEVAEFRFAVESRGGEGHHRHRADDHQHDAEPQVGLFVVDEARRDALVDDIALLEEELPGRDRRADDGDDEQHHVAELGALREVAA